MNRDPHVYIVANRKRGTLYTGVTANLPERIHQHRTGALAGFTRRYGCKLLVYYEGLPTMAEAIAREKQIKSGSRLDKIRLIENFNQEWRDLYETLA